LISIRLKKISRRLLTTLST